MKNMMKYILTFILSILAIFYSNNNLNIIMLIPLLAFFMFNGIKVFLCSILGITFGTIINIFLFKDITNVTYMLISIALFFFLYLFNLLVNKKLILNYLVSTILSIIITYLIYLISNDCFSVISFLLILLLTLIICFMFAFLIKQFSFHLISKLDISSPLLISSLLILYISNIANLSSNSIISNLTLFLMLFVMVFYASKNKVTYVLSLNALIILLSIIFNIVLVLDNLLLFLLVSVALSLNKSKIKILNTILTFACLLICLIINNNSNPLTYFIFSIIISLLQLFININEETYEDKTYYKQYINNKKEIIYQLDNFRNMFSSLSNNFYNARLSKILNYLKEDIFDSFCKDCNECIHFQKKG